MVRRGHLTAGTWECSPLGDCDPEEQRLCGHVVHVREGQEMLTFSEGSTETTQWEVLVVYGTTALSRIITALTQNRNDNSGLL